MKTTRSTARTWRPALLATLLAAAGLPSWSMAGEAPGGPDTRDLQKQLEEARQRLDAEARTVAELSRELGRSFAYNYNFDAGGRPRALLGIMVDDRERKDGAHVREVSPGGAAAEAGIKAGDVITSIDGYELSKDSDPGRALVERMRQVEPDKKVQVGVLRDGKKLSFDVTPRRGPTVMFTGAARGEPGVDVERLRDLAEGMRANAGNIVRRIQIEPAPEFGGGGARFGGMEFATLSERLGGYFGVKSGVLVVRAGADAPFKLQDGDVILAIDGREPSNAQHVGRILRSYQSGEKVKLRVQRDRRAQDIEATMPDRRGD